MPDFSMQARSLVSGRAQSLRGRQRVAMHVFAGITALMVFPLMALSVHMTAPTMMLTRVATPKAPNMPGTMSLFMSASITTALEPFWFGQPPRP